MSYPAAAPFNPPVSTVPVLGPSSGNPKAFQDPNSVASIGNRIQAMSDQVKADTLYDAPPPKREGFTGHMVGKYSEVLTALIGITGLVLVVCSFLDMKRRR